MKKIYLVIIVLLVNYTISHAQTFGSGLPAFSEDVIDSGLPANNNITFSVYPNPTVSNITVKVGSFKGERISVMILDLNGRLVGSQIIEEGGESTTVDFNLCNFSKGLYLIKVFNGQRFEAAKLVVKA